MKTVRPELTWDEVQELLEITANDSSDPRVDGYVNAEDAVRALRDNPAPTVAIVQPVDGSSHSWNRLPTVLVDVMDPPFAQGFTGTVTVTSDLDGEACQVTDTKTRFSCSFRPRTTGTHQLTAVAEDPFFKTGRSTISVEVTNATPLVAIFSPGDGRTFLSGQPIRFTAEVSDFDETIPDDHITWTSDVDGDITPALSPRDFARSLSDGSHEITLTAVDGFGASASDSVHLEVGAGSGVPVAQIVFPPDEGILSHEVTLQGTGFDSEDGELSGASLEWEGSRDGSFEVGLV
jgi:hypothetical protein